MLGHAFGIVLGTFNNIAACYRPSLLPYLNATLSFDARLLLVLSANVSSIANPKVNSGSQLEKRIVELMKNDDKVCSVEKCAVTSAVHYYTIRMGSG